MSPTTFVNVKTAGLLMLAIAIGGCTTPAPAPEPQPLSSAYLGLWPERSLAEAKLIQASVASGDQSQAWRESPAEVAERFVVEVMGWDVSGARVSGEGTLMYTSYPSQVVTVRPGGSRCPSATLCPWWEDHDQFVTVAQLVPGSAIWSVTMTQTYAPPVRSFYAVGERVDTNANLRGDIDPPQDRSVFLGGKGGSACSGKQSATLYSPYKAWFDSGSLPVTIRFSAFRSPACGRIGNGYIALMVGDSSFDPLAGSGRYIPALTMMPVQFIATPPLPEVSTGVVPPEVGSPLGSWKAVSIDGAPVTAPAPILEIERDSMEGTDGCNTFRLRSHIQGNSLDPKVGPLRMTDMGCNFDQQDTYMYVVTYPSTMKLVGDSLTLTSPRGTVTFVSTDGSSTEAPNSPRQGSLVLDVGTTVFAPEQLQGITSVWCPRHGSVSVPRDPDVGGRGSSMGVSAAWDADGNLVASCEGGPRPDA